MAEKFLRVEISTPEKQYQYDQVVAFFAKGAFGYFEILPDHAPYVVQLQIGEMRIRTENGEEVFATSGGVAEVRDNVVHVLTRSAEKLDEIDVERARKAKERAEERLKSKNPDIDVERAQIALMRALNRLQLVQKYMK